MESVTVLVVVLSVVVVLGAVVDVLDSVVVVLETVVGVLGFVVPLVQLTFCGQSHTCSTGLKCRPPGQLVNTGTPWAQV